MKKVLIVTIALIILAGCSKKTEYTNDLTGTWTVYDYRYLNQDQNLAIDTFVNYAITFTSGGQYSEVFVPDTGLNRPADTVRDAGTWRFIDNYGQLVLSQADSAIFKLDTFTIFNLTANTVELTSHGWSRYMRKNQ